MRGPAREPRPRRDCGLTGARPPETPQPGAPGAPDQLRAPAAVWLLPGAPGFSRFFRENGGRPSGQRDPKPRAPQAQGPGVWTGPRKFRHRHITRSHGVAQQGTIVTLSVTHRFPNCFSRQTLGAFSLQPSEVDGVAGTAPLTDRETEGSHMPSDGPLWSSGCHPPLGVSSRCPVPKPHA